MATAFQLPAEVEKVVDLAVENKDRSMLGFEKGLVCSGARVKNAQSAMGECTLIPGKKTARVGPPVCHTAGHVDQPFVFDRPAHYAKDAAHLGLPSCSER